jgi:membrane carboxypeptidase/penicillin-binding protein PbpC
MFKKRLTININQTKQHFLNHKKKYVVGFVLLIAYYFCLPKTLFNKPYATVIESHDAHLLGAKIASDGQWRFPMADSVTHKFETCILLFEDQHFYQHPGFNPVSLYHAAVENIKAQKIVRGGSTITQQVIRLSREAPKRSFFEKIIELIQATRLEWRYSKKEILQLYASHAPFGGNVVGVEMASWRYFGVPSHQLSWAESATLAVLPNAPSLIHLGKNRPLLIEKRNRLLARLFENQLLQFGQDIGKTPTDDDLYQNNNKIKKEVQENADLLFNNKELFEKIFALLSENEIVTINAQNIRKIERSFYEIKNNWSQSPQAFLYQYNPFDNCNDQNINRLLKNYLTNFKFLHEELYNQPSENQQYKKF